MEMDDDIKASADACIERIKIRKAAEKNTLLCLALRISLR